MDVLQKRHATRCHQRFSSRCICLSVPSDSSSLVHLAGFPHNPHFVTSPRPFVRYASRGSLDNRVELLQSCRSCQTGLCKEFFPDIKPGLRLAKTTRCIRLLSTGGPISGVLLFHFPQIAIVIYPWTFSHQSLMEV